MLSAIGKKIIQARLYDKSIHINIADLDNILINSNNFTDNNNMYNYIVDNWRKLIIE